MTDLTESNMTESNRFPRNIKGINTIFPELYSAEDDISSNLKRVA